MPSCLWFCSRCCCYLFIYLPHILFCTHGWEVGWDRHGDRPLPGSCMPPLHTYCPHHPHTPFVHLLRCVLTPCLSSPYTHTPPTSGVTYHTYTHTLPTTPTTTYPPQLFSCTFWFFLPPPHHHLVFPTYMVLHLLFGWFIVLGHFPQQHLPPHHCMHTRYYFTHVPLPFAAAAFATFTHTPLHYTHALVQFPCLPRHSPHTVHTLRLLPYILSSSTTTSLSPYLLTSLPPYFHLPFCGYGTLLVVGSVILTLFVFIYLPGVPCATLLRAVCLLCLPYSIFSLHYYW